MRIGYGRVSTRDQHPESQRDALVAVGCEEIFVDIASRKLARRPELSKALLMASRTGDQLVITKLDRLGRSTSSALAPRLAKAVETSRMAEASHRPMSPSVRGIRAGR